MGHRSVMMWASYFLTGLALTGCCRNQCCNDCCCSRTPVKGGPQIMHEGPPPGKAPAPTSAWNQPPNRSLSSSPVMAPGNGGSPGATTSTSNMASPPQGRMNGVPSGQPSSAGVAPPLRPVPGMPVARPGENGNVYMTTPSGTGDSSGPPSGGMLPNRSPTPMPMNTPPNLGSIPDTNFGSMPPAGPQ